MKYIIALIISASIAIFSLFAMFYVCEYLDGRWYTEPCIITLGLAMCTSAGVIPAAIKAYIDNYE